MISKILEYVLARVAEKTTWAALVVALANHFGWQLSGVQVDSVAQLVVYIIAAILAFLPSSLLTAWVPKVDK